MGREARRVPLDFDWPQGKVWKGYVMPDGLREQECSDCGGDGYSVEAQAVANTFYPHQIEWGNTAKANALAWHDKIGQKEVDHLIKKGCLRTWVHDDSDERGRWESLPRTADQVNAEQRRGGLDGHDAINRHILIEYRCKRLGITLGCGTCEGHGSIEKYPGQRAEAEAWEWSEPPTGEGWQMWETTSEGSPSSPVFATAEELASWLAETGASMFGSTTATRAEWLRIITGEDFAHVEIAPGVVVM
jgi:hypothetical protein